MLTTDTFATPNGKGFSCPKVPFSMWTSLICIIFHVFATAKLLLKLDWRNGEFKQDLDERYYVPRVPNELRYNKKHRTFIMIGKKSSHNFKMRYSKTGLHLYGFFNIRPWFSIVEMILFPVITHSMVISFVCEDALLHSWGTHDLYLEWPHI